MYFRNHFILLEGLITTMNGEDETIMSSPLLQLNFISLAENESKARVKFNLLEKMIQPCGPPTEKKQED